MQLSSSDVQQGPGGHHTQPHFQQTIMFHGYHLSAGTMRHKLAEFLDLYRGNHSVYEYIQ
jgi:hypothetical protein